ncbi:DUF1003 domain-containing protein [Novosphingobium flavum]|uniref:DUF1003 domain-containing protein n=1 Tax=Novosphingobium flavum TaxID=1778672 RepID=UPI0031B58D68
MKLDTSPEALAVELLGRPYHELDEEEQHILRRVMSSKIELDPDETEAAKGNFGDRLADRVAAIGGSWSFIIVFAVVLLAWMLVNGPLAKRWGVVWDGYPFIFLNLVLSTLAALQAPIIMMSQNRQAKKDRISNRHDYEVNLRTTVELLRLHRKIDGVFNKLGQLQGEVKEVPEKTGEVVNGAVPDELSGSARDGLATLASAAPINVPIKPSSNPVSG